MDPFCRESEDELRKTISATESHLDIDSPSILSAFYSEAIYLMDAGVRDVIFLSLKWDNTFH